MEEDFFLKIRQGKGTDDLCLFPKEEWESLIRWQPVSNIPTEEIYKDLPKVKEFHDNYVKLWLTNRGKEI